MLDRWKKKRWPAIKKAIAPGAHLAFLDESGFLLIPNVCRTWAPRGQTPILHHFYRRERISAISTLAVSPKADTWPFTSDFRETISSPLMWQPFCAIFCNTSVGMSSSYGTELSSIEGDLSATWLTAIQGSIWNGSPDMPRSSIRWNLYGPRPSAGWPIAPLAERRNLSECGTAPRDTSNVLNVSSGLASGPLNCLGKNNIFSINYA